MVDIHFLRPTAVQQRRGGGHSKLYDDIAAELWPPFIKFGRCSVQPAHEVDAMLAAIVAGATPDELRQLVRQLVAERKNAPAKLAPHQASAA